MSMAPHMLACTPLRAPQEVVSISERTAFAHLADRLADPVHAA